MSGNLYSRGEDACSPGLGWFIALKAEYSRHALVRIRLRGAGRSEVERVLLSPQEVCFGVATSSMVAIGERPSRRGHWLIAVCTKGNDVYRVVTV